MPIAEFSRFLEAADIPPDGVTVSIAANPQEAAKVAERLAVPRVHALSAKVSAEPSRAGGYRLHGRVSADVDHECVVSLEEFRKEYRFDFERHYVDASSTSAASDTEIDPLSDDEPDFIEDGTIDIGEMVVELLALALDPYPRKTGITFEPLPLRDEHDPIAEKTSPFAVLDTLKQRK